MKETNTLNATIVRNIDDIEAAYARATDEIEKALAKVVFDIFETEAKAISWRSGDEPNLDSTWAAPVEWRALNENPSNDEYDLYLMFFYTGGSDRIWLSTLLGAADMRAGVFVFNDTLSHAAWKKVLRSSNAESILAALSGAGFTIDIASGYIAIYVQIDRDLLAQGFEDGDISDAFRPLERALKSAIDCRGALDQLLALVREAVD